MHRRVGNTRSGCPAAVPAQLVADFLKAFALRSSELAEVEHAGRLVRHAEARWLLIEDGSGFRVYDHKAAAFVDAAVFTPGEAKPKTEAEKAADVAYQKGYQALRAQKYDEARPALKECLEHQPEHVGCHWEMGWVHWVAEDWPAAAASWSAVEAGDPDYPELKKWLAKAKAKVD